MDTTLTAWPDWLVRLDPELGTVLASLDRHRKWLAEETREPFVYKRLSQAQVRQFEDLGLKNGAYLQEADGKRVNFDVLKRLEVPEPVLRAMVYNAGQLRHTLEAYRYTKKLVCRKLVEEIPVVIQAGDFFSALSVMKALYENLGDMVLLAGSLSAIKPAGTAHPDLPRYDAVLSREFRSAIDWTRLAQVDLRKIDDIRTILSVVDSERQDDRMDQQAIAGLEKRMHGIAAAYTVLSELVSPRVGSLWAVYEDSEPVTDAHKTQWNRNRLGPDFPQVMVGKMKPLIVQLFGMLDESLALLNTMDRELFAVVGRIDTATQDEVRTWLWRFPRLFAKHENCPCGSGKRVQYCCAER